MNKKRGISPLIATVLLVALVIVIALLIFWWYGELVANELDKSDITADQVCVQDVDFSLSEPDCSAGPNPGEKLLSFSVENTGSARISSFRALIDGNSGNSFTQEIAQGVQQGVSTKVSVVADTAAYGTLFEIEVIPMINAGGTSKHCSEQSQFITISCT